ncbi:hypothetical protein [Curtobacterium sp. MCBA15_004]|uniref:hypothetical protein n=1 Tax=Curtobacterium sp. MCBA15_004 TaxID=1898733 RepID=UPI0008DCF21F|nr:hypothetical protein [Curtobacterium sp. MCBA15_004]WIA96400.1 hypothetical protein QOL16_15080 [Curtobacterium sp. MCBA15_004]
MNEQTAGREEARRAREEARSASKRIDALLDYVRTGPLAAIRESRQQNHYTDKVRRIVRGEH